MTFDVVAYVACIEWEIFSSQPLPSTGSHVLTRKEVKNYFASTKYITNDVNLPMSILILVLNHNFYLSSNACKSPNVCFNILQCHKVRSSITWLMCLTKTFLGDGIFQPIWRWAWIYILLSIKGVEWFIEGCWFDGVSCRIKQKNSWLVVLPLQKLVGIPMWHRCVGWTDLKVN